MTFLNIMSVRKQWLFTGLCMCMIIILAAPVQAQVTCHCFKEREFKSELPASADPYLLATARNNLVAAAAGLEKAGVVRQRMTGASETDIWLAEYLAVETGRTAGDLNMARNSAGSWTAALDTLSLPTDGMGESFNAARRAGSDDGMAGALADRVILRTFKLKKETLETLRNAGADTAETVLSVYLGKRLDRAPKDILDDVRSNRQTWSSLVNSLGISLKSAGQLIGVEVRSSVKK